VAPRPCVHGLRVERAQRELVEAEQAVVGGPEVDRRLESALDQGRGGERDEQVVASLLEAIDRARAGRRSDEGAPQVGHHLGDVVRVAGQVVAGIRPLDDELEVDAVMAHAGAGDLQRQPGDAPGEQGLVGDADPEQQPRLARVVVPVDPPGRHPDIAPLDRPDPHPPSLPTIWSGGGRSARSP
jgi:hypothetical protein